VSGARAAPGLASQTPVDSGCATTEAAQSKDWSADDYLRKREDIVALVRYLDLKLSRRRPEEAEAARVLLGLVMNEKVGG
jgi:hypothetical protein